MDYQAIHRNALEWMINRGWKRKWGKKGQFTQSLLEHTDVELNALFALLPIIEQPLHYNLTELEEQAVIVGTIAHDVGKETDEWQKYVQSPRAEQRTRFVPHIIPELTQVTVPQLVEHLGFGEEVIEDAIAFVNAHMAAVRTPTTMMGLIAGRQDGSSRWATLARIVDTADNFCSARGLFAAMEALESSLLSQHLHMTYHLTRIRGVSTTMLHRAAMEAFIKTGWSPLLHFSNGTIYVADSRANLPEPATDAIQARFAELLDEALTVESAPQLVVGRNFSSTVVAKPELFNPALLPRYLDVASTRMRVASFLSGHTVKPDSSPDKQADVQEKRRNRVQAYLEARRDLPNDPQGLGKETIEWHIQRFADAQPEMGVWVLFNAAVKDGLIPDPKVPFEATFGVGSYERFKECPKQRQYAKNMIYGVELFWELPGCQFGLKVEKVEQLPPKRRLELLKSALVNIVEKAQWEGDGKNGATSKSADNIAQLLMTDLIHPITTIDPAEVARNQLEAYASSKERAKKGSSEPHTCPICNASFPGGDVAKADIVAGVESHTNRALAHGRPGSIVICEACKYELYLRQLLLGERTSNVLVLFPRMNIGPQSGELLRRKAIQIQEIASTLMSADTANPNERLTLALTHLIARQLMDSDDETSWLVQAVERGLEPAELIELMTYDLSDDKQKEYRQALEKGLRAEYKFKKGEEDVAVLNEEWETDFSDWETTVQAVLERRVRSDAVDEIWVDAQKLRPIFRIVCKTAHMILVPLSGISPFFVGKDSATNAALRELFVTLLLGLALDCSVAVIDSGEPIAIEGGEGVARVPAVPAVRKLIGGEWVGLTEAPIWLRRIGAASLLASATVYPESSNLYQILSAPTPGHILRRIEQKQKGQVYMNQLPLIEAVVEPIKEVSHA